MWQNDVNYMSPGRAQISVGEPIPSSGETLESLKAKVRAAILELRNDLPLYKRDEKLGKLAVAEEPLPKSLADDPDYAAGDVDPLSAQSELREDEVEELKRRKSSKVADSVAIEVLSAPRPEVEAMENASRPPLPSF